MNQEQLDSLFGSIEVPEYTIKVEADNADFQYQGEPYIDINEVEVQRQEICLMPAGVPNVNGTYPLPRAAPHIGLATFHNDEFLTESEFISRTDPRLSDKQVYIQSNGKLGPVYYSYNCEQHFTEEHGRTSEDTVHDTSTDTQQPGSLNSRENNSCSKDVPHLYQVDNSKYEKTSSSPINIVVNNSKPKKARKQLNPGKQTSLSNKEKKKSTTEKRAVGKKRVTNEKTATKGKKARIENRATGTKSPTDGKKVNAENRPQSNNKAGGRVKAPCEKNVREKKVTNDKKASSRKKINGKEDDEKISKKNQKSEVGNKRKSNCKAQNGEQYNTDNPLVDNSIPLENSNLFDLTLGDLLFESDSKVSNELNESGSSLNGNNKTYKKKATQKRSAKGKSQVKEKPKKGRKKLEKEKMTVKILPQTKSSSSHKKQNDSDAIDLSRVVVKSEFIPTNSYIKEEIYDHNERENFGYLNLIVDDEAATLERHNEHNFPSGVNILASSVSNILSVDADTQRSDVINTNKIQTSGAVVINPKEPATLNEVDADTSSDDEVKKPISCEYCGKQFALPGQMTVHLRRHSGVKPYKCQVCGRSFAESGDMRKHERIHTGEKPYSCPTCGKAFALAGNLAKHKLIHTNIRPFKCHYCDSAFRRAEGLKKHIQTHTGEKPFTCDVCNEKFARAGSLKEHYRRHTGEKPYACEYCNQRYARSCDLDKHIRVHTNEKPYVCSVCSRGFKQSVVLRRHMRIHTGEKNYVCSECGKAFSLPGALKIHFRLHTNEKPYKCDVCGKKFGNPSNRDTHQKVHVDGKKVCCEVCGKAFIDEKVLEEHKKVHAEKKPYHCDMCSKSFTCPSQLEIHYRVHSNVRPFTCTICSRAFKQKSTAETHLTKIHQLKKDEWTSHITQADIKRRFLSLSNL